MPFYAQHIREAQTHLKRNDATMRNVIRIVGPFTLKTQKHPFQLLVKSIISQQISTAAARTIIGRLHERLGSEPIQPAALAALDVPTLRALGVSLQKATYCHDLAEKVSDGTVSLTNFSKRSDDEIIESLTRVKGIGVWTAQMFLIFGLGRLDILPTGDLGIRTAIKNQYELNELPSPSAIENLAEPWRPYASIASWYLWRTLDNNG